MAKSTGKSKSLQKPVGQYSKIDPYGFERGEDFDYKSYENFESEYLRVLANRLKRWNDKIFENGKKEKFRRNQMLKRFCRKGIPESYRGLVWLDVSGATKLLRKNPNLFAKLRDDSPGTPEDETLQESIKTDLDRTFPDNINFQSSNMENKKQPLYNILIAYGRHTPRIGYCQGMNYVTALLLLVVKDEERCFWLLVALIDNILPQYYTTNMAALRAELNVLTELVRHKYPNVQNMMESEGIPWTLISSKWFICLYIDILPIETVLRIWDCLFYEGNKILFRVALLIIKSREEVIKKCSGMPDIIESFKELKNDDRALECHQFVKDCFMETSFLTRAELEKLRKKHMELIEEEDRKMELKRRGNNGTE